MSKERLEEIRTRLKYGLGCLKHLRREILNSDDESLKDQINLLENDIKYLFEQAERVQELESQIENWQKGRYLAVSTIDKERDLKNEFRSWRKQSLITLTKQEKERGH